MKLTPSRIVMFLIGLAVLAGLVVVFMPRPVVVDVAPVTRQKLVVTVDEDGRTRIRDRYIVSAPLGGELQRITLRAGDPIEAGQTILAEIIPGDPALLDARAIAEAEARVRRAEAALRRSKPILEQARAQLDFAENELARTRTAFQRGAATQSEMDAAVLQQRQAQEEFNAAQFTQDIAQYELELAQAALIYTRPPDEQANALRSMIITAPITGRVLRLIQESKAIIMPGTELLEVGDPMDLEIEIDVLSTDAVRIAPGAPMYIEHWGGDHVLNAVVRTIEPQAFTHISALGVEEQRVYIIGDFVDPPEQRAALGDAYRVEAAIVVWQEDDVLCVPTSALFRIANHGSDASGQWAVFIVEEDRARLRPLHIGRRTALLAQVIQGLEEGQQVIVHPSDAVADGVRVQLRE